MRSKPERLTHDYDGELVVFLIGMRINRWSRVRDWLPTFRAMPPMITELMSDPDSGAVGYRLFGLPRTPTVLLYWTSLDKLYEYASDPDSKHRPAWGEFNRRARTADGSVGIWHETFQVERAETFYYAMPPTGLGAATALKPVTTKGARGRMREGRTASA
ncbi:DUF4188 domain-containing protein [Microbacterium halotolerans]|uniref:DUF4188 domain-containing protein n=1 Tax=Microbacterium halotolerans TaxID=246613 RepID=UPI000E6ADF9C|nr:DUF4188 domain-containing protein [Microbacterium halotolerans]